MQSVVHAQVLPGPMRRHAPPDTYRGNGGAYDFSGSTGPQRKAQSPPAHRGPAR